MATAGRDPDGSGLSSDEAEQIPSPARMYDYFLGGRNNLAVDRAAAARIMEVIPNTSELVWENRRFLQRAVRFLAEKA